MDSIVTALGAETIDWSYKTECCGGSLSIARTDSVVGLVSNIFRMAREAGGDVRVQSIGSMFTVFFRSEPEVDFATASGCDLGRFARFHRKMLSEGVYWPPSQFETCFVSEAHGEEEFERTLEAARKAFRAAGG